MVAGSSDGSGTGGSDPRPAGASRGDRFRGADRPDPARRHGRPAGPGGGFPPGAGPALAVGSMAGALALVLVARRSMEAFVLLVLVLRPTLDGLHASSGVAATDPARVLGVLFVAVSLVWWGSRWLEGRRHPSSAAGLALAAFLVAAAVATLGSEAPGHSAAELARLGTAVLMFFVVDRLCEDTGRPDRVLGAVLAAAAIPVAVAVAGPLVGISRTEVKDRIERAISTFSQSNPFGHFLTITVLVLVAVVLARSGRTRLGALLALVPVGVALALTYTRLAWAAAVVGVLVMLWVAGKRRLVPALIVLLSPSPPSRPNVGHRIDQLTSSNPNVVGSESGVSWRWGQWADVAAMAGNNPDHRHRARRRRAAPRQPPAAAQRLPQGARRARGRRPAGVPGPAGRPRRVGRRGQPPRRRSAGPDDRPRLRGRRGRADRGLGCGQPVGSGGHPLVRLRVGRRGGLGRPAWLRPPRPPSRRHPPRPSGRSRGPGRSAVDGGQRMSSLVRVPDSVASLAQRARRWWPIGVAVAVIARPSACR